MGQVIVEEVVEAMLNDSFFFFSYNFLFLAKKKKKITEKKLSEATTKNCTKFF